MAWFEPVLGTVLVTEFAPYEVEAAAEEACLAEIARLDLVLSRWRDDSELALYNRGERVPAGELAWVLAEAERWRVASGGIFDGGRPPHVDLDGIAKGYVVDRALAAVSGTTSALVNIGGDLACRGTVTVAIEDPTTPYDNAPPLTRVTITDRALATSGTARRGMHIRDPRTGRPASVASATVVASDAMTADALATIAGILPPDDACAFVESHGASCLIVTPEGPLTSASWPPPDPRPPRPTRDRTGIPATAQAFGCLSGGGRGGGSRLDCRGRAVGEALPAGGTGPDRDADRVAGGPARQIRR